MLKIRLKRLGRKKLPHYRIVVIESKRRRDGLAIKEVGVYSPIKNQVKLDVDTIKFYLNNGAQPTKTVLNLLISANVLTKTK